jgi:uncharacterized protein YndB with AHSA1/START domain
VIDVEVRRTFRAPRARVWAEYTDHAGWTRWAGVGKVRLVREGQPERDGVGAVRAISNLGVEVHEEVTGFEPERRMTYRIVGGPVPMRDHAGEVLLDEEGGVTTVRWRCQFRPAFPGLGLVLRLVTRGTFERVLGRLERRLRA